MSNRILAQELIKELESIKKNTDIIFTYILRFSGKLELYFDIDKNNPNAHLSEISTRVMYFLCRKYYKILTYSHRNVDGTVIMYNLNLVDCNVNTICISPTKYEYGNDDIFLATRWHYEQKN